MSASTSGRKHTRNGRGRFIRSVDTAERDAEACRLRSRGYTYERIAAELGFSGRSNARAAVQRALLAVVEEPAAELRTLELARLDDLVCRVSEILEDGEPGLILHAVDRLLKIQERRARLLGLDAPTRVDATVTETTQQDLELQELLNEARARHATRDAELKGQAERFPVESPPG